jgi:predicted transcriptional regulator
MGAPGRFRSADAAGPPGADNVEGARQVLGVPSYHARVVAPPLDPVSKGLPAVAPDAADRVAAAGALGPLEARLMATLWTRGSATVPELVEAIRAGGHRAAYTTILTVVSRLHARHLLEREAEGRSHRYRPTLTEAELLERSSGAAVAAVLERFGPVALRQFAVQLGDLDPAMRRQLVELAGANADGRRPDRE